MLKNNPAIYAFILFTSLFVSNAFGGQDESIQNDLDHLLGRTYYIMQAANNRIDIIIFPRFTVDLSGNAVINSYSNDTVSFIENQLEKKYNITVSIQNP